MLVPLLLAHCLNNERLACSVVEGDTRLVAAEQVARKELEQQDYQRDEVDQFGEHCKGGHHWD